MPGPGRRKPPGLLNNECARRREPADRRPPSVRELPCSRPWPQYARGNLYCRKDTFFRVSQTWMRFPAPYLPATRVETYCHEQRQLSFSSLA